MKYLLSLLAILLTFPGAATAQMPPEQPQETSVLLGLGDSLFTGYGIKNKSNIPQMVGYQLIARRHKVVVKNISRNDLTLAAAAKEAKYLISKHHPKVVLICLGGEDVRNKATLVSIYENLNRLVGIYRQANIGVVLIGFALPDNAPAPYHTATHRKKFYEIYQKVAQTYQVPFYPDIFHTLDDRAFYRAPDRYHLNERGVQYVSRQLYPAVEALLR